MNSHRLKLFYCAIFLLTLFTKLALAGEFAVSPMMIDLHPDSKSTQTFSFTLFGKSNTNIKLSLFNMKQLESGYMGFIEAPLGEDNSVANWITLEQDRYRVRIGQTVNVNGKIKVPARAAGTHLIAVMAEEELPDSEKGGVTVKIRYAVILNINVKGKYKRIKGNFSNLAVITKEDGIYLQGDFINNATTDEWLFSEVQLRNEQNRLIERVQLKTESAWQRNDAGSKVFPQAKVIVYGKITKPYADGNYKVLAKNSFAGKSQAVYRDILHLKTFSAKHASVSTKPIEQITISPESVEVKIKKNGSSFTSFSIQNNHDKLVTISLLDVIDNLPALGISSFQFYPSDLILKPQQSSRVVLKQSHIKGAEYGNITFFASVKTQGSNQQPSTLKISTELAQHP